jgi:hypothetical protein
VDRQSNFSGTAWGLVLLAFDPAETGDLVVIGRAMCGGDHGRSVGSGLEEEELHGKTA